MSSKKAGGLGRGFTDLFADDVDLLLADPEEKEGLREIAHDRLVPGRYQPRNMMNEEGLAALAASIRDEGLVSPILVRPLPEGRYEIVAGERRWRAAGMAGLPRVPVLVKDIDDRRALMLGLVENMQREDLNPLEEAEGIARLHEEFGLTHEACARALGRSRTATTNLLRLLALTDKVKEMVATRRLDMGHARALLALEGAEQISAAQAVVERDLSVRQTEALVKAIKESPKPAPSKTLVRNRDNMRLEEQLALRLGAVVRLNATPAGKGKIVIEFSSLNQLQGIIDIIQA